MGFDSVESKPLASLKNVGIAITISDGQTHVGILYRDDDLIRFAHLLWHHIFRPQDVAPDRDYLWDKCAWLEDDDDTNPALICAFLHSLKSDSRIPFGFAADLKCFASNGDYIGMEAGKGLTCASFVMSVFHMHGFEIIDTSTWKSRDEDAAWQKRIVDSLRARDENDHAEMASKYIGSFRYRAEEVAGAAVNAVIPVGYDEALRLAAEILAQFPTSDHSASLTSAVAAGSSVRS
jgi:hypothetical protein